MLTDDQSVGNGLRTMQHVGGTLVRVLKHAGVTIAALCGRARGHLWQVADGRFADVADVIPLHARPLDGAAPVAQSQLPATLTLQCHSLSRLCHTEDPRFQIC